MILSIIIQIHCLVLLFALCLYIYLPAPTITDQHDYEPHCMDLYIRILLVLFVYIVFSLFLLSRSFTLSLTNVYFFSSTLSKLFFSSFVLISLPDTLND